MLNFRPPIRATKTLRPIFPTQKQAANLAGIYIGVLSVWSVDYLTSIYSRTRAEMVHDSVGELEIAIEQMASNAVNAILNFRFLFDNWLAGIVRWHAQKFAANLKYATNVELSSVIGPAPADTLQATIARNVALVRNVSDKARQDISEIIYRGLSQRTPVEQVAREIREALGMGRARSRRIASDQLSKISAALDTSRANDLGLTSWEWKHSGKIHFRPWHKARDGNVYEDGNLPADVVNDQPGFAPFCGCKKRYRINGQ